MDVPTFRASAVNIHIFSPAIPAPDMAPIQSAGESPMAYTMLMAMGNTMAYMDQDDPKAMVNRTDAANMNAGAREPTPFVLLRTSDRYELSDNCSKSVEKHMVSKYIMIGRTESAIPAIRFSINCSGDMRPCAQ